MLRFTNNLRTATYGLKFIVHSYLLLFKYRSRSFYRAKQCTVIFLKTNSMCHFKFILKIIHFFPFHLKMSQRGENNTKTKHKRYSAIQTMFRHVLDVISKQQARKESRYKYKTESWDKFHFR